MGVRLYPNTQDKAKLEILAGVPAGTYARMEEMEAHHQSLKTGIPMLDRYDLDYECWKEKSDDGPIGDLDHFITFGWGKFNSAGVAEDYSGSLDVGEPGKIAHLFIVNRIAADPIFCEGVHWC